MIILGLILIIVGYLLPIPLLMTLGVILLVIGLILWFVPSVNARVGGRRWY